MSTDPALPMDARDRDFVLSDYLVSAGAAEEACAGTQPPRVYFGPFQSGTELGEEEVDFRLDGP